MPFNPTSGTFDLTPEMERLMHEKNAGLKVQERKHEDWDENYKLYRNKVEINRLTQRQAVNIPLMKETVKTLLSKIDDAPSVEWKELGGDEMKELIYQELWNDYTRRDGLELLDIIDKKNVLLYGFSAKKLNIDEAGVHADVLDPYDVVFDPIMLPWDIETSRFIIHQNIFRTVRDILADDRYTKDGKDQLKIWADTPDAIVQSGKAREEWEKKMERIKSMGTSHDEFGMFAAGDTIVNLSEHYTTVWNKKAKDFERRVITYANDVIELSNEKLEDLIGVDFWPFDVWQEDPETTDVYSDSVADTIRPSNKVLNVWISQLVENRTLKNFQMHWFLPSQNYTPQTYTPGPGVMLPAPPGEDINKVIRPVEVSGLDDTLAAIQGITQIAERATGATALEKGEPETGTQTLGEVQVLVGKASERATGMAKFYRLSWYRFAKKWDALMHANKPKSVKLFKTGRSGKAYIKTILRSDWQSDEGYEPIIRSTSEQEAEDVKGLQKLQFVMQQFPQNAALRQIMQRRALEILDLSPQEMAEIEEEEKRVQEIVESQANIQNPAVVQEQPPQQQPVEPEENNLDLVAGIQQSLAQLENV